MAMKTNSCILGIDTSNYTTSVALINEEYQVLFDERILLEVNQGQRGLRQSDAVFKHTQNLPKLLTQVFKQVESQSIKAIAVSTQPRNIEGSYMPTFLSGKAAGEILAGACHCPLMEFSHQEGHIRAGLLGNTIDKASDLIVFHLSGGTNEILQVKKDHNRYQCSIIGQTKDISFGQLIDRIGVKMGYPFPSGRFLDQQACDFHDKNMDITKNIHVDHLDFNLSGMETQLMKVIENGQLENKFIINSMFTKILICLEELISRVIHDYGNQSILFVGGVSASQYIRNHMIAFSKEKKIDLYFSHPEFSTDNAVGIACLGMDMMVQI